MNRLRHRWAAWWGGVRRRFGAGGRDALDGGDSGRAVIEVVILGVLVLIPTIYLLIGVLRVQAATLAVNQAARDAGRAMDAAPSTSVGLERAREIAGIALRDQHVPADGVTVTVVSVGGDCGGSEVAPSQTPGDTYDICVVVPLTLPGVPSVVTGSRNTVTGVYTVHVGELREGK